MAYIVHSGKWLYVTAPTKVRTCGLLGMLLTSSLLWRKYAMRRDHGFRKFRTWISLSSVVLLWLKGWCTHRFISDELLGSRHFNNFQQLCFCWLLDLFKPEPSKRITQQTYSGRVDCSPGVQDFLCSETQVDVRAFCIDGVWIGLSEAQYVCGVSRLGSKSAFIDMLRRHLKLEDTWAAFSAIGYLAIGALLR